MTKYDGKWWIDTPFLRQYFSVDDTCLVLENVILGLIPFVDHPDSPICE